MFMLICDALRFLAIYKGIVPPILAETPKRATKFFTFEQYKKLFSFGAPSPSSYVCVAQFLCLSSYSIS